MRRKIFVLVSIILILLVTSSCKKNNKDKENESLPVVISEDNSKENNNEDEQQNTETKIDEENKIVFKNSDESFQISTNLRFLKVPQDEKQDTLIFENDDKKVSVMCQRVNKEIASTKNINNLDEFYNFHKNIQASKLPEGTDFQEYEIDLPNVIASKSIFITAQIEGVDSKAETTYTETEKAFYVLTTMGIADKFNEFEADLRNIPFNFTELK